MNNSSTLHTATLWRHAACYCDLDLTLYLESVILNTFVNLLSHKKVVVEISKICINSILPIVNKSKYKTKYKKNKTKQKTSPHLQATRKKPKPTKQLQNQHNNQLRGSVNFGLKHILMQTSAAQLSDHVQVSVL